MGQAALRKKRVTIPKVEPNVFDIVDGPNTRNAEALIVRSAVEAFDHWQKVPHDFANDVLQAGLWDRQIEIIDAVFRNKKVAVKSGHKIGKTYLLAVIVLTFLHLIRPSLVITTAPTWRQVEKQLWQEVRALVHRVKAKGPPLGGDLLDTQYRLGDKHFAFGFSSEHGQAGVNFQGFSGPILFIFDEAGGVPQAVWDVVETCMVHSQSRWLCTGNPHDPATPFYTCFGSKLWKKYTVSSWDTPNAKSGKELIPGLATRDWCQERLEEWGKDNPQYQFRVLGEFPDGGVFTLIRTAWVRAAIAKARPNTTGPKIKAGGVDVARFGDDSTCIVGFEGTHMEYIEEFNGADLTFVAGRVSKAYREQGWQSVVVDDTGVGGGVTDMLSNSGLNVIPINFGEQAADDEHYYNISTEMYVDFARELKDGLISGLPDSEIILREFTARKYEFDLKQRMKLQPKAKFKEEVGQSPDRADAIVLARWGARMAASGVAFLGQCFT